MANSDVIAIGSTIKHRGEYNNSATYYFNNQVTMYGSIFQALGNNFSGVPPLVKDANGEVALANTSTWKCIIDNVELYNTLIINDFSGFAKRGEAVGSIDIATTETNAVVTTKSVYGSTMSSITITPATKTSSGIMSAEDKTKLENNTSALAEEAKARKEADTTLTTNLQKVIDGDVYLTQDEYEALATKDPDKTYYIYED